MTLRSAIYAPTSALFLAVVLFSGCATNVQRPNIVPAQIQVSTVSEAEFSLVSAQKSLALATDQSASAVDRTTALHAYNASITNLVLDLQKDDRLPRKTTITIPGYQITVATTGTAVRNPTTLTKLVASDSIYRKHLQSDIRRSGLGATFVGVTNDKSVKDPNRSPAGYAQPLTVIATFGAAKNGVTPVTLSFIDPRNKELVTVNHATFKLAGDFTAPLAYYPRVNNFIFGLVAMLRSDRIFQRSGIYMVEPYDPNKIPILFVHGLMSSPQAFINFMNELDADPSFRSKYQAWVYFYPSGGPIAGNALLLRKDLAEIAQRYPLKHNIILVGHSMGGILSQFQVTKSDRILWDYLFKDKADANYASVDKDSIIKKALIFEPSPYIDRVIFFSVPHRGSSLADLRISALAARLIRMPSALISNFTPQVRALMAQINPSSKSVPTSILGLSPRNPLLKGLDLLPITVPYNSVIGNQGRFDLPKEKTSDGIVAYWSSHMDGAQSELIVPTGHNSFDYPGSVTEVLRILGESK